MKIESKEYYGKFFSQKLSKSECGSLGTESPEKALYVNRLMQTEGICAIEGDNADEEEEEDEVEDPIQTLKRPNNQQAS